MTKPNLKSSAFWQKAGLTLGGLILGAVLGEALRGDSRLFLALCGLTAITFLVHLLVMEDHTGRTLRATELVELLSTEWASIRAKFGLDVDVQLVGEVNRADSVDLDKVSQAMWCAKNEILVADVGSAHVGPDIGLRDELREAHLQRLAKRAADPRDPLTYFRLYQVRGSEVPDAFDHDPILHRHFEDMCALNERHPDRVFFGILPRVFPAQLPLSWVLT